MQDSAHAALAELCAGFVDLNEWSHGEVIDASLVPEPFDRLLVHNDHMTTRLGEFHGAPVELRVLRHAIEGDTYRRLITLQPRGRKRVVEVGLVRIDLACTNPGLRAMILDEKLPLGDILISQDVMRRIEPKWFLKYGTGGHLAERFDGASAPYYGRLGVIYFEERPAIRLLEVVCGA